MRTGLSSFQPPADLLPSLRRPYSFFLKLSEAQVPQVSWCNWGARILPPQGTGKRAPDSLRQEYGSSG